MGENQAYHYCTGLNDKKEQNIETIYKHSKLNYIETLSKESEKFYEKISKEKISSGDCKEALKKSWSLESHVAGLLCPWCRSGRYKEIYYRKD